MTKQEKINKIYGEINFPYDDGDGVYSPVMIGDVLDWIENDYIPKKWEEASKGAKYPKDNPLIPFRIIEVLYRIWKSKRLPIDEQSEGTISYIFDLIKDGK